MVNQSILVGIAIGTFFAGLGIGYAIFQSPVQPDMTTSSVQTELEKYKTAERIAMQHIETFDDLDFNRFTNQDWEGFKKSHSEDIIVYWPDGSNTVGLPRHIEDLDAMFEYAPDTRIEEHPIKIASGEWTAVVGIMEGTFTAPMILPDGTVIEPTGKAFKLTMCTVGHWKDGVMVEEYLFWDNQTFMKQIGLA